MIKKFLTYLPAAFLGLLLLACLWVLIWHAITGTSEARPASDTMKAAAECNLEFTTSYTPVVVSRLESESLSDRLVAAAPSCSDSVLSSWNAAQEQAGSDIRACRYDASRETSLGFTGVGACFAPVDLTIS